MIENIKYKKVVVVVSIIMAVLFLVNLVISLDCNLLMVVLTSGGHLVNYIGASYDTAFIDLQLYRLITYGYLQPAIWHLLANVFALWYVGIYLERKIGTLRLVIIYHFGVIFPCIAFILLFPNGYIYGASPAIFCCLGMMTTWLVKDKALWNEYKYIKGNRYLICYMIISNFLGSGTLVIHLLGFCLGLFVGLVVKKRDIGNLFQ